MTKIEWTEKTWNPIVGCSVVSPGCTNCYAMKMAARLDRMGVPQYAGLTTDSRSGPVWNGKMALAEKALTEPLRRKKPTIYFVNSMGDLIHEDVPDEWIDRVFAIMALCPQHTFQVLTKRAARMREYVAKRDCRVAHDPIVKIGMMIDNRRGLLAEWPLPNVWLGVSAEDQTRANERIPDLLATPAAVRFVSSEPLLGAIDLTFVHDGWQIINALDGFRYHDTDRSENSQKCENLDWIIVGGESGNGARPMHPDWARSIRDQCAAARVPFFFKQWGEFVQADQKVCPDSDMGRNKAVWLGWDGRQAKPSHIGLENPIGVIRIGKKAASRLLDDVVHDDMPPLEGPI